MTEKVIIVKNGDQTRLLLRIAFFLLISAIFALSYTQAPLYTSNQNQYFLHGLAQAGYGFLQSDWLANTTDPTPLFSLLVEWTFLFNQWEGLFYVYYALLMGVYLFTLIGITKYIYPQIVQRDVFFTLITCLLLIHSAGFRFSLSRVIGINWTYIMEDGVADQRLLGSVFQPSTFGVLLLLSIYLFLSQRKFMAVISAVGAATFHPTYLMSAGILIFTYMILLYKEHRRIREPLTIGLLASLVVVPVFLYVISNFGNMSNGSSIQARQILVDFRIPHHALFSWWFDATAVVKLLLICTAFLLVRRSNLFLILSVPFSFAFILTVFQVATKNPALALLFPWRISTWLVPISTAILAGWCVTKFINWLHQMGPKATYWLYVTQIVIICLAVSTGIIRSYLEYTWQAQSPEHQLFDWINKNKSPSDRYLVPIKMQDFRLVTGVPIFVDFKSIPYQDNDVLEWHRRVRLADKFYDSDSCDLLKELAVKEGINHFVLFNDGIQEACPQTKQVYSDAQYSISTFIP